MTDDLEKQADESEPENGDAGSTDTEPSVEPAEPEETPEKQDQQVG